MENSKNTESTSKNIELVIDGRKVTVAFPKDNANDKTMKLIETMLINSYVSNRNTKKPNTMGFMTAKSMFW
jgi:hypothetical protein